MTTRYAIFSTASQVPAVYERLWLIVKLVWTGTAVATCWLPGLWTWDEARSAIREWTEGRGG